MSRDKNTPSNGPLPPAPTEPVAPVAPGIVDPPPAPVIETAKSIVIASPAELAAFLESNHVTLSPGALPAVVTNAGYRGGDALLSRVITVLVQNPKSGASRARFDLYRTGDTVAQYIAKGGRRGDIAWDTAATRGFIKLSD